ncbi:gas vesicle protein [Streptomyces longisporoflavus]|uniref:GvpL/GvpF family gas vesicle protein n=1 Tax=Streptomyces longisporoflavus TaxID=28044 RepID=UPI00167DCAF3|nr:GvpL/GvpF family gas vesicle protein [Streptomyces longisporoflavus]GGV35762.1 gas vesicle protein [Streptomyces longisporoflavus]
MSTYIYGIVAGPHPDLPERMDGVGAPPLPVRILRCGELAALVSDVPADLRPGRRDLEAHHGVLSEAGAPGAVLPMRFGSLAPDDEAVLAILAQRADHYAERLRALDSRVEYNVKVSHNERAVLHQVLGENPELRAMVEANQLLRGGSYEQKLDLGEKVAATVRAREASDADHVRRALEATTEAVHAEPAGSGWLTDLSFLVHRDAAGGFLCAVDELRVDQPHLDLRVRGPLPPYSFAEPGTAEPAG